MSPRRVLIVKPTALGDVVQALPMAGLVRRKWPGVEVGWVVATPFRDLLDAHEDVSHVFPFERRRRDGAWRQAASTRRLASQLRAWHPDVAIDLQGLFRSGWLTWRSGARRRVGFAYAREGATLFYNDKVPARPDPRNAAERYLDAAEHLGAGRDGRAEVPVTAADEAHAEALLAPMSGGRFAVLLPGTNWATKRWPASHFARLARLLEGDGLAVVVAGAHDAREAAREVGGEVGGLDLTGRTTVRQLAAVLKRASLVVANDSGPMHLAASLVPAPPLVAVFGPTDPRLTGPHRGGRVVRLDIACAPCLSRTCTHRTCTRALSPEAVYAACRDVYWP